MWLMLTGISYFRFNSPAAGLVFLFYSSVVIFFGDTGIGISWQGPLLVTGQWFKIDAQVKCATPMQLRF